MVREMKHTEIGEIPAHWELQTFEETFRVLSNNTLPRADLNDRGGTVRNVHYGDILTRFGEVLDCEKDEIPYLNDVSLLTASAQVLQDGDVVLADIAVDVTVGKATEIYGLGKGRMVAGLHTIPCRVKKGDFVPKWLGYYMNSHMFHDQVLPYITGIKVSSISKTALLETLIAVPPLEEQKAIVSALSAVDQLMAELKKTVSKLRDFKRGCLYLIFPQKGSDIPQMREPGYVEPWRQHKLSELSDSFEYGLNAAAKEFDGENKYIRITDIADASHGFNVEDVTSPDTDIANAENYKLTEGDILFARTGASVGKTYIYKETDGLVYYAGFLIRAKIKKEYNPEFVFQNTLTADYEKYIAVTSQRSGQPGVNAQEYSEYKIMVPDKAEQDKISAYLGNLDHLITLHQQKIYKYAQIKNAMMSELITGKMKLV